ncbi:O-antigen ligase family protein [Aurantiacibacter spongiae]|uniref:O-antigen ligase domain-containing protein n=1 Tax=Aurantiacibacter spongiae TaxID=2488860 RepID=A0A3N5DA38_9SPHN|nr:O-antigen ligase family protein [Aurantiacibacter spongiae]RPF71518.1 hypothetical protein EG799_07745 [Aurantiacibacter spongiae]
MASVPAPVSNDDRRQHAEATGPVRMTGAYVGAILIYAMLMPPQFSVSVGDILLPLFRIVLLVSIPYVLRSLQAGRWRWRVVDSLVLVAALWIFVALYQNTGLSTALSTGGGQVIEIALSYFLARSCITSVRHLRFMLVMSAPGLIVVGGLMALESVSRTLIIQPLAAQIMGDNYIGRPIERLGLLRTPGPFAHPILGGVFLCSFLPIYALSSLRGWPRIAGLLASFCGFFSISSAAILALVSGTALVGYNFLVERVRKASWRLLLLIGGVFLFVAQFATEAGAFRLLVRYASLNSASAFNRVLIWRYGSASVENNPLFGSGIDQWERPVWMQASVDNYWLLLAIQYGILPPLLLIVGTIVALVSISRAAKRHSIIDRRLLVGVAVSLAVFAFGLVSVAAWLSLQTWYFFLLGSCVSLGTLGLRSSPATLAERRT